MIFVMFGFCVVYVFVVSFIVVKKVMGNFVMKVTFIGVVVGVDEDGFGVEVEVVGVVWELDGADFELELLL